MGGSSGKLTIVRPPHSKRPRKCVGCGRERSKKELLRVARSPDGAVAIDVSGKAPGRGAYVCADLNCIEAAGKRNALSRTLKQSVDKFVYLELKDYVANKVDLPDAEC